MTIRYFATNRDPENLAQLFGRRTRLGLWRGGYHFVDMKKFMSHYLATVDDRDMASDVLVQQSEEEVFGDKFLGSPGVGAVAICVHGYNVDFHEACTSFSILAESLRNSASGKSFVMDPVKDKRVLCENRSNRNDLIAIIGFSWPSNGKIADYALDQRDAVGSASTLANLIGRIRCALPDLQVHVISHSMGNLLVCEMLKVLIRQEHRPIIPHNLEDGPLSARLKCRSADGTKTQFFVDRLIVLAADVERRHITKSVLSGTGDDERAYEGPYYRGLHHLVNEIYSFYSRHDRILDISNVEKAIRGKGVAVKGFLDRMTLGLVSFLERNPDHKWEERLGATRHPPNAPPNMQSRNAVELTGREIGHGDYVDSKELAQEIAKILVR